VGNEGRVDKPQIFAAGGNGELGQLSKGRKIKRAIGCRVSVPHDGDVAILDEHLRGETFSRGIGGRDDEVEFSPVQQIRQIQGSARPERQADAGHQRTAPGHYRPRQDHRSVIVDGDRWSKG
jgi:hypothetical protein